MKLLQTYIVASGIFLAKGEYVKDGILADTSPEIILLKILFAFMMIMTVFLFVWCCCCPRRQNPNDSDERETYSDEPPAYDTLQCGTDGANDRRQDAEYSIQLLPGNEEHEKRDDIFIIELESPPIYPVQEFFNTSLPLYSDVVNLNDSHITVATTD